MPTRSPAVTDLRQELVSAVTTLRLLVDGWRDGIVDPRPGTADGTALRDQVLAMSELVDELSRQPAG